LVFRAASRLGLSPIWTIVTSRSAKFIDLKIVPDGKIAGGAESD
jgi:hypothetical protein